MPIPGEDDYYFDAERTFMPEYWQGQQRNPEVRTDYVNTDWDSDFTDWRDAVDNGAFNLFVGNKAASDAYAMERGQRSGSQVSGVQDGLAIADYDENGEPILVNPYLLDDVTVKGTNLAPVKAARERPDYKQLNRFMQIAPLGVNFFAPEVAGYIADGVTRTLTDGKSQNFGQAVANATGTEDSTLFGVPASTYWQFLNPGYLLGAGVGFDRYGNVAGYALNGLKNELSPVLSPILSPIARKAGEALRAMDAAAIRASQPVRDAAKKKWDFLTDARVRDPERFKIKTRDGKELDYIDFLDSLKGANVDVTKLDYWKLHHHMKDLRDFAKNVDYNDLVRDNIDPRTNLQIDYFKKLTNNELPVTKSGVHKDYMDKVLYGDDDNRFLIWGAKAAESGAQNLIDPSFGRRDFITNLSDLIVDSNGNLIKRPNRQRLGLMGLVDRFRNTEKAVDYDYLLDPKNRAEIAKVKEKLDADIIAALRDDKAGLAVDKFNDRYTGYAEVGDDFTKKFPEAKVIFAPTKKPQYIFDNNFNEYHNMSNDNIRSTNAKIYDLIRSGIGDNATTEKYNEAVTNLKEWASQMSKAIGREYWHSNNFAIRTFKENPDYDVIMYKNMASDPAGWNENNIWENSPLYIDDVIQRGEKPFIIFPNVGTFKGGIKGKQHHSWLLPFLGPTALQYANGLSGSDEEQ